jgi:hypothetical protein
MSAAKQSLENISGKKDASFSEDGKMNVFMKACNRILASEQLHRTNQAHSTTNSILPRKKAQSSISYEMAAPCENGNVCKIFPVTTACDRKRQAERMHTSIVEPKRQCTGHNVIAQNKGTTTEKNPFSALPDENFYNNDRREMNAIDFSSTSSLKGTKSCRKNTILHRTEKAENQFIHTLKHPRTAYNFFVQSEHSNVSKNLELQEASKSSNFQKTGKILGQKWKEMNPSEKQKFEDLAKLDITRYQKEVKEYYAKSLHQMKAQNQVIVQGTPCNTCNATLGESRPFENSIERLTGLNTGSFEGFLVHNNVGCDHPVSLSTMPPFNNGFASLGNPSNVVPLHGIGQYIPVHDYFRTPQINQFYQPSSAGSSIPSYADIDGIQFLDCSSKSMPMSRFLCVPFGRPTSDTFGQQYQILPFVQNDPNSTTYGDRGGMQLPGYSSKSLPMGRFLPVPFGQNRDSISDTFRKQSQTSHLIQNDPNLNANTDRSGMQSSCYSGGALPMSQLFHVPFGQYRDAIRDTFGQHSQTLPFLQNDPNSNDLGAVKKSMFYPK